MRHLSFLSLLLIAAFVSVGCSKSDRATRAAEQKILLLGNGGEPKTLDPQLSQSVGDSNILNALFEGLVTYHPTEDSENLPGGAESWEANDDYTIWTFKLRPEAKWSNGDPVTAHDYVYSYSRILHHDFTSPYVSLIYNYLKNAEEVSTKKLGYILCGRDPDFPVEWEILQKVDFQQTQPPNWAKKLGKDGVAKLLKDPENFQWPDHVLEADYANYRDELDQANKPEFNYTGLDFLKPEELKLLQEDPTLFRWPNEVPKSARKEILSRLLAFHEGGEELFDLADVGVKALDDHTLELTLKQPTFYFPQILKHPTWFPIHRETIEKFGGKTDPFTRWTLHGNHIGNGAFKLKYWRINHSVTVVPNEHYWDREMVKLNEIQFLPIENQYTEERMFRDKLIHHTYIVPPNLIEIYQEKHPDIITSDTYAGSYFYRFNTEREPLNNPLVRKALTLAVDRESIVKNIKRGGEQPAYGFTPPIGEGYKPPNLIRFDPELARQTLAEAGYPNGKGLPNFDLKMNTHESHRYIAEAIQEMWKKHLNVEVGLSNQEWKVFQQTVTSQEYEISRAGWIGDYIDPTTFLDMWKTGDSNNNTGWGNKDYDRLLDEASLAASPEERYEVLKEAERIMLEELPILPIYWYTAVHLKHPALKNWNPNLLDKRDYKFIDLEVPKP